MSIFYIFLIYFDDVEFIWEICKLKSSEKKYIKEHVPLYFCHKSTLTVAAFLGFSDEVV